MSHRFNVNFSEGAYRDLSTLAKRKDTTMSEVLRDAIALERWFEETRREGGKAVRRAGGWEHSRGHSA